MTREHSTSTASGAWTAERGIAWIFGFVAIGFISVGLLVGFGIVGPQGVDVEGFEGAAGIEAAAIQGSFWDAYVWLLVGFASGLLAFGMSRGDPHHGHHAGAGNGALHGGTYLFGLLAIGFGALALLVGFNMFNMGHVQTDGVMWGFAALGMSAIAAALHAQVPSIVADEDYLVRLVESRVGTARPVTGATQPGTAEHLR